MRRSFPLSGRRMLAVLVMIAAMLSCHIGFGQNKIAERVEASFNDHNKQELQEKLYVHSDKSYYLTGELLWFKLYYTDAGSNRPINLSTVAYIEILDAANLPVLQAKAGLHKGEGTGSVYLPQNIISGNYKLRAYTQWMKNFPSDYFFEKTITIVNLNKFANSGEDESAADLFLDFFPEGGQLISGTNGKLAFKCTDGGGRGLSFTGYLLQNNDTLLRFAPSHNGMGSFVFTPQNGYNYKAIIVTGSGKTMSKVLPQVQATGTSMLLSEAESGAITVTASTTVPTDQMLHLVAHTGSDIKIVRSAPVQNGKSIFTFMRSDLGDGVSHITIFNNSRKPVSERLYFKAPEKNLNLKLNTIPGRLTTRKEVDININSDALTLQDTASLSMTVFRLDSLQAIDDMNILNYLFLSSELKGVVQDPGFYFSESAEAKKAADDLMLTQGWRRFKWDDVVAGKKPNYQFSPEVKGHIITGKIVNSLTGQPQEGIYAFVGAPSYITQFDAAVSGAAGNIKFEIDNFFGGTSLVAQTDPTTSDSIYRFRINSPFSTAYNEEKLPDFKKPVQNPNTLLKQSLSMQVQNIYTQEEMNQLQYSYFTDTMAFYVKPDFSYKLDNYTRFTSMEEVLREYVAMVNVRRRNGKVELPIFDPQKKLYVPGKLLNLLDGVPVFDYTRFFELDPLKVKSLDVITQQYIYGELVFGGVLNWKTYKPSMGNYTLPANASVFDYEGLLVEREFYSPKYDSPENLQSRLPDYRTVLQWNPHIKLTGNNKASVKFHTSDLPGKYAVVVEGLSKTGLAGTAVTTFEVQ